jgi:hypothetical protein
MIRGADQARSRRGQDTRPEARGFRGYQPAADAGAKGREVRRDAARARAADLAPIITRFDPERSLSLRASRRS